MPIHDRPAMQSWIDGLVAVLDAVGSECVSVFAMSESALPAMLLAASHPHRVRSLVVLARCALCPCARSALRNNGARARGYLDGFEQTVGEVGSRTARAELGA